MMMKEELMNILNDIDDEILKYDGSNMLDDGIIDSFTIMEIVTEIEDHFNVKIAPADVTEAHFKTVDAIMDFIKSLGK